jgi:hypothetical protein
MTTLRSWSRDERLLLAAGLVGLVAAAFIACGDDDDASGTPDACAPGCGNQDGGRGGSEGGSGSVKDVDCEQSADATEANTAEVVSATELFLQALTSEQRTAAKYDKTLANAQKWSNFPTTFVQRNGVKLSDMSSTAQAAAVVLAEVAAGSTGSRLLDELREADEWLVTNGKAASSDYGRGLYYFSIHGTPSTGQPWMLQIGGHHLAYNFTYNGKCTSATPLFDGAEPMDWTDGDTEHSPLEAQRSSMKALFAAVGSMSEAKLSGTLSDLVNGPAGGGPGASGGGGDTNFPSGLTYPEGSSGRGVKVSSLSSEQKALVKTAIEAWVKNVASPVSSALLAEYESDVALEETYVAYAGSMDLSTSGSYARIDGPRVWIEASVQNGIIYRDIVHYHTVWRDKVADYGAEYNE